MSTVANSHIKILCRVGYKSQIQKSDTKFSWKIKWTDFVPVTSNNMLSLKIQNWQFKIRKKRRKNLGWTDRLPLLPHTMENSNHTLSSKIFYNFSWKTGCAVMSTHNSVTNGSKEETVLVWDQFILQIGRSRQSGAFLSPNGTWVRLSVFFTMGRLPGVAADILQNGHQCY